MSEATKSVVLPDGSSRQLPASATAADLAADIGPGLARATIAAKVDGELRDLSRVLPDGARVALVTRSDEDLDALYALRHSAAHVLATAVRELYPRAGIGFGPPIETGFYYDFDVPEPFKPEDLERIEGKMREVAAADHAFSRREVSRAEAEKLFADDPLKLERLAEIPGEEAISTYTDGPFTDLCRGPHVSATGEVQHFKLLSAAGAYWRGDETRPMLQRIYGTAFFSRKALDDHLHRLEEAKRRDHRKLGQELDLFSFHDEFGPGPEGLSRRRELLPEVDARGLFAPGSGQRSLFPCGRTGLDVRTRVVPDCPDRGFRIRRVSE